jgi:hypothetical protein
MGIDADLTRGVDVFRETMHGASSVLQNGQPSLIARVESKQHSKRVSLRP